MVLFLLKKHIIFAPKNDIFTTFNKNIIKNKNRIINFHPKIQF